MTQEPTPDPSDDIWCWRVSNDCDDSQILCEPCAGSFLGAGYTSEPVTRDLVTGHLACEGCGQPLGDPGKRRSVTDSD